MSRLRYLRQRGSVSLVALCCLAVLGIGLASFLVVGTTSMRMSNRSFHTGLSAQLAEIGLEEGLRALNENDWSNWSSNPTNVSSGAWSFDATYKRATRTISFQNGKFGQGVTATVKIRVDNYDAYQLGATWSSSVTYRTNDLVGYNGIWYRSVRDTNTNNTPSDTGPFTWWVPAPIPWVWNKNLAASPASYLNSSNVAYALYDLVNYNGIWFRCTTAAPANTAGTIPSLPSAHSTSSVSYVRGDVVYYLNQLYHCKLDHTSSASILPTNTTYWDTANTNIYWTPLISSQPWVTTTPYVVGDVVNYAGTQYRCILDNTASAANSPPNTTYWSSTINAFSFNWSSSTSYSRGSIVLYNSIWYYCRQHGTGATNPSLDTTRWAQLLLSTGAAGAPSNIDPLNSTRYSVGDYVYRSSTWYRCTTNHVTPASPAATWVAGNWSAAIPYISWAYRSSGTAYAFDDVVCYGASNLWYRYINATSVTNQAPGTSYWEYALSGNVHGWMSGINFNPGDVAYYSGTLKWYRCIKAHTSSGTITPSDTTYWAGTPLTSPVWDPNRLYSANDIVSYNGNWYFCINGTNNYGQVPASASTYWTQAPLNIAAWDSTKYYNLDDRVSYAGTWYRCILPHSAQTPTNTTYWASTTGASYAWNATTAYSAGTYRSYGGAWYKCLAANTGQSPNNTTYWTSAWSNSWGLTTGVPIVYAEATVTLPDSGASTTTKTQVRANIAPAPLFPNAVGATTTLTIATTGTVDSYDGSVYATNTGGTTSTYTYNQTAAPFTAGVPNVSYSAVLAAGNTSGTSLSINGAAAVKGYLAAYPSSSTYVPLYSTAGSVKGPLSPASPSVDTSRISRSPYIPAPDTRPSPSLTSAFTSANFPYGRALNLTTTVSIGTPGSITASRYYYNGNLDIGSLYTCSTLNINGPVKLYINGYLYLRSLGAININGGGSLEVHTVNGIRVYSGAYGFVNRTQDPKKLFVLSEISSTTTTYHIAPSIPTELGSNNPFYGVVYMPRSTATLGFDVRTGVTVYGAISAREVTFSTEATLHYDTSLRYTTFEGVDQPFAITQWRELTDLTEQATMP